MSDTEKEEKIDYLEVDETIPGQNMFVYHLFPLIH